MGAWRLGQADTGAITFNICVWHLKRNSNTQTFTHTHYIMYLFVRSSVAAWVVTGMEA